VVKILLEVGLIEAIYMWSFLFYMKKAEKACPGYYCRNSFL